MEDRRTAHRDRINNNQNIVTFQQGNVVVARREVFSDKAKHRVGKLQYQISGPFVITRATGHGSYFARKLQNKTGTEQKFMAEDLYLLPPTLLPCEPIDGADIRYLNYSHPTITHPFAKDLDIKSYHATHFSFPNLLTPPKI